VFGPKAQLLRLCGHLLMHRAGEGETRQLWLHDVAEVIANYRDAIDWDESLARAREYDLSLPLQRIMAQVFQDWQPPVPDGILEPSPGERRLHAYLAAGSRAATKHLWAELAALPGRRAQFDFCRRNLFPPAGYMRACYRVPRQLLVPLYYPYRWFLALRGLV